VFCLTNHKKIWKAEKTLFFGGSLKPAYPNPNEETLIFEITVKKAGLSTLDLYNMVGQKIATVYDGSLKADSKTTIKFDVP